MSNENPKSTDQLRLDRDLAHDEARAKTERARQRLDAVALALTAAKLHGGNVGAEALVAEAKIISDFAEGATNA